jgi:hypothetical protein
MRQRAAEGLRLLGAFTKLFFAPTSRRKCQVRPSALAFGDEFAGDSSLQQPVCLTRISWGCRRKAAHFGGGLPVAGDVRRDGQAANRDSFALSL